MTEHKTITRTVTANVAGVHIEYKVTWTATDPTQSHLAHKITNQLPSAIRTPAAEIGQSERFWMQKETTVETMSSGRPDLVTAYDLACRNYDDEGIA